MDIAMIPSTNGDADIAIVNDDILIDDGLETAVYISLFTDMRDPASSDSNKHGYWGDTLGLNPFADSPLGSLLWEYSRVVIDTDIVNAVKTACKNSLQWMITDGIAESVSVTSEKQGNNAYIFDISIKKPGSTGPGYLYRINWEAQGSALPKMLPGNALSLGGS
jgi:phage gp46-like protein